MCEKEELKKATENRQRHLETAATLYLKALELGSVRPCIIPRLTSLLLLNVEDGELMRIVEVGPVHSRPSSALVGRDSFPCLAAGGQRPLQLHVHDEAHRGLGVRGDVHGGG